MTKTIVTGSTGFIGSHLMKRLNDVLVLDHEDIKYGNSYDADQMFFLSTYGNMAHHTDGRMIVKANVEDLITVLNHFTGWVCFMSSSSVTLPVQTPYSRAKKAAEEILMSFPNIKSCIVRPYSVTGVGEQREHLIPTLIRSCMEGEEMPFDPNPVHDFVDVDDVVDGLIRLSEEQATGIHELGMGFSHSNFVVKEWVQEACRNSANILEKRHLRPYDGASWYCHAPSKYFQPTKTLQDSISEMVEAYRNEHA